MSKSRTRGLGLLFTFLLSATLSLQASAYSVTTVTEAPQWQIDWSYNQARPDWQEPVAGSFENWTVMLITIEEALQPYVSENDLLAIFVNGEVRGLAGPTVDMSTGVVDATHFLLKAYGNESSGDVIDLTMMYYNAQLEQIFSLTTTLTLEADMMIGFDEDFIPEFTLGSAKYPVVTSVNMAAILASSGITPAEGDIAAAFVGDECRGVLPMADGQILNVFQRDADETVVLMYYDSTNSRILSFEDHENYLPGDTSGDGTVDVSDYISIANYILGNVPEGFNEQAADVNNDGVIDVSDYIGVANLILYGTINGK